uniref:von Willebrand factor A domain containing 5A n=1 Tax=Leptobrachium leishanense TaxID=445787 RepID=A0A8C5P6G8_9ANUR
MSPCCGLIIVCSRQPVPLKGISVDVQVKGFVANVIATLKYKNLEEKAIEAVFVFPMDDDAAVYSFKVTVEGKQIVADLQEKEQAHKTYDEAIGQGEQAFLLEEDESSGDIFKCNVGNLLPGQEAEVTLCYVRELPVEADGAVRFVLPAVLNPRYTPKDQQPSVTANLARVPIGTIPYTLSLDACFESVYGISKIESNCDISPIQYTNGDKTSAKVSLAEGHRFGRDVELLAYYSEPNKPSVSVEAGSPDAKEGSLLAEPVLMLNFYPSFPAMQEKSNCGEFIFVVDRSGSMECQMNSEANAPMRIQSAKETLILLLKSLPLGCYFNVFGFGSHFESFFPESMEYTQASMDEAVKKVSAMEADLGGTEILEPLQKIYKTAGRPGHPRQLFVFTDGEVGNTEQVLSVVRKNAVNHRCFTFGIGEGASTALIKGMAQAGNGTAEFITGKDRMQPKVLQALKRSLQPTVTNIALSWDLPPGLEATLLSRAPNAIFQGQRCIVYAQIKGKVENPSEGDVCLEYKFKDELFKNSLRFSTKSLAAGRLTIHRLAAKALISELEDREDSGSEETKKRILETSLLSGVVSSLTAYVAVNKDTKKLVEGPPLRRDIPTPYLMGGGFPAMRMMGCAAPGMPSRPMAMACCASSTVAKHLPVNAPEMIADVYDIMSAESADLGPSSHLYDASDAHPVIPEKDPPFIRLISLQNADGSWNPSSELAAILGTSGNFKENCPDQSIDGSVWATLLAVIWLHASSSGQRDEWELLEEKAVSWLKSKAASNLGELVKAGNELLKSSVELKVFGL